MNITIIQVYAPTTDYDDEAVEAFYEELENTIKETPKKDFLIIQGDWNAKIGTDAYDDWGGTAGRFGLGETNDRTETSGLCKKPQAHCSQHAVSTQNLTKNNMALSKRKDTQSN